MEKNYGLLLVSIVAIVAVVGMVMVFSGAKLPQETAGGQAMRLAGGTCGDGTCDDDEDCDSCPGDCDECDVPPVY